MKPALSVLFFTVLSGAGYGLWFLLGVALAIGAYPTTGEHVLVPLIFGFVLVSAGLSSSTLHLGRPERSWRALSQWRSSWLSREGVASLFTYLPVLALAGCAFADVTGIGPRADGGIVALCSLVTVFCTANIYRSLKTIRAWRAPEVLPLYFLLGLLSGGLWFWTWETVVSGIAVGPALLVALAVLAVIVGVIKISYWHHIDHSPRNTAGHATGLEMLGDVRAFEGPATEESYLIHEFAFVIARRHSTQLRLAAITLFAVLPVVGVIVALSEGDPGTQAWVAPVVAVLCIGGLFIERWLFFAEARHAVAAFFPRGGRNQNVQARA